MSQILTLTTDFGSSDEYVAILKGLALQRKRELRIVDVTHDIFPQRISSGAWVLSQAWNAFPEDTGHLAVIDPEVSDPNRHGLLARANGHVFCGPDNGLFGFLNDVEGAEFWKIPSDAYAQRSGPTFDARDIFLPAILDAMASDEPLKTFERLGSAHSLFHSNMSIADADHAATEIIHIDHFGNLITPLRREMIPNDVVVSVHVLGQSIPLRQSYGKVEPGEVLAFFNHAGVLEVAIRNGSAADRFGARVGEHMKVSWED